MTKGHSEGFALGRQIDGEDVVALEEWATRLCSGLSIEWMADALNVDATVEAVVSKIAGSIPDRDVRIKIEAICRREIFKTGENRAGSSLEENTGNDQ